MMIHHIMTHPHVREQGLGRGMIHGLRVLLTSTYHIMGEVVRMTCI